MTRSDFLIIGGGIIGISIARELKKRHPGARIAVIEKEAQCGLHASGRNSGVLHAGFYYSSDSLKAKFTRLGNRQLTEYCKSKKITVNNCGKLVVARDESEWAGLDELLERARKNGVLLQDITETEARSIEPRIKTCQRALFSPTTSSVNPDEVMQAMALDAVAEGITLHTGAAYLGRIPGGILTSRGPRETNYIVNAAGLYADRIGKDFGFSEKYRILPFKGLYLYSSEPTGSLRTHIYPVPDLRNPFLGVHFTLTARGRTKIGPTAIPALWREQYRGWDNFNINELIEILGRQFGLLLFSNFDFKQLAVEEIRKQSRHRLVALAGSLATDIRPSQFREWGKPGIRAQLLNVRERKLEMDFVLEGDDKSMHILNAVSPAFTCALPFAEYTCDQIDLLMNRGASV